MKKLFFLLSLLGITFISCEEDRFQYEIDEDIIVEYVEENNIDAIRHSSGLYYRIVEEGTGANPTVTSVVEVKYKGTLLDGTIFDQTTGNDTFTSPLGNLISGWQIGIPLIKRGGKIELIIPSGLAYGRSSPSSSIPANSILVFEITLVDFA